MRIDQLKAAAAKDDEAARLIIADPSGEPYTASDGSPVTLGILGKQSKAYRDAQDDLLKSAARRGKTSPEDVPEIVRRNRLKLAVAGVSSAHWNGWEDADGQPIPFSPTNVWVILDADDRVLDQVESAIERHHAFFSKPSAS